MTPCDKIKDQLTAYIDREMDEAQAGEITAHLEKCPPCSEAAHAESAIKKLVHDRVHLLTAAPHVRARIRRELGSLQTLAGFWGMVKHVFALHPRPAFATMGIFIVGVSVLSYFGAGLLESFADPVAYRTNARLEGKIICADCQLMLVTNTPCKHEAGVHRLVLKCSDGKLWNIVQSPPGRDLLQTFGTSSQLVQTEGYLFPRAGYIQVTNFKVMRN